MTSVPTTDEFSADKTSKPVMFQTQYLQPLRNKDRSPPASAAPLASRLVDRLPVVFGLLKVAE